MTIPSTLNLTIQASLVNYWKLNDYFDVITNNTVAVLQETIREVAQNRPNKDSQRVKNLAVLNFDGIPKEEDHT